MNLDEIDFSKLPDGKEEAFIEYVQVINDEYEIQASNDRSDHVDRDGTYAGIYEPERSYVTAILAFLDEYDLSADIIDISDIDSNNEFFSHFSKFRSKVQYLTTRFKLRRNRIESGSIGTVVQLTSDYKSNIGQLLEKIRKIVNQEISDQNKRGLSP